ncbi:MAG: hypothetical protein RR891_11425 [Clostridium sp.]|uniref:hypothetical protein n=1 Tax=Clostridium sp. TaxID=1506 RepID=UPI00304078C6
MFQNKNGKNILRGKYLIKKEENLRKQYLALINSTREGTLKKELYEVFKDEMYIINTSNLT